MCRRSPVLVVACLCLTANWACGPQPDLKRLKLIPQLSGYYDDGLIQQGRDAGQFRLLPSVTFQVKNEGNLPLTYVDLTLAFWRVSDDGEKDSMLIEGIGRTALEPGATSDSITVRSTVGYTAPSGIPAEFFTSPAWVDFKVKVFARKSGRTTSLGELAVERRILPAIRKDGPRP